MKTLYLLAGILLLFTACLQKNLPSMPPSGMIPVFDTELYYRSIGNGPPIVILHSGPGLDHSYFLPHLEPLAQNFQLIFYDQRFAGRSALKGDSMSLRMDQLVEDLEFLREHFGLEKLNLMGHSMGGLLAMWYAKTYPDRLHSMLLVNSVAPNHNFIMQTDSMIRARRSPESLQLLIDWYNSDEYRDGDPQALYYIQRLNYQPMMYRPAYLDSIHWYIPPDYPRRMRRRFPLRRDLDSYDFAVDLKGLEVPTLIVHGAYDPIPEEAMRQLSDQLPQAELVVFPYSGHFSFVEEPEQLFRVIRQFMRDK